MPRIGLLTTLSLTLASSYALAEVGSGLDLQGIERRFPISKKVIDDEFFGVEEFWALETESLTVKTSNSGMFSSAALIYGLDIKPVGNSTSFENPVAVSAYFNALKTLSVLESELGYKLPSSLQIVIDRYIEAPWTEAAPNLMFSEAGFIRQEGQIAFSPASEHTSSLAKSIDIVAHEIAHAVVANTSKLDTSIGSQLINEAFADIIGIYVESKLNTDSWNWKIGDSSYNDGISSHRDIKDVEDPRLLRHIEDVGQGEGVYFLSGIVSTSFYYLATGENLQGESMFDKAPMDTLVKLYFNVVTKDLERSVKVRDLKDALVKRSENDAPELTERIIKAFETVGM